MKEHAPAAVTHDTENLPASLGGVTMNGTDAAKRLLRHARTMTDAFQGIIGKFLALRAKPFPLALVMMAAAIEMYDFLYRPTLLPPLFFHNLSFHYNPPLFYLILAKNRRKGCNGCYTAVFIHCLQEELWINCIVYHNLSTARTEVIPRKCGQTNTAASYDTSSIFQSHDPVSAFCRRVSDRCRLEQ